MKKSNTIILVAFVMFVGVVVGVLYANQNRFALDVAGHSQRIANLESERAERVAKKAITIKALKLGACCLKKITFGLVKLG